jgi:hypothetical protein
MNSDVRDPLYAKTDGIDLSSIVGYRMGYPSARW